MLRGVNKGIEIIIIVIIINENLDKRRFLFFFFSFFCCYKSLLHKHTKERTTPFGCVFLANARDSITPFENLYSRPSRLTFFFTALVKTCSICWVWFDFKPTRKHCWKILHHLSPLMQPHTYVLSRNEILRHSRFEWLRNVLLMVFLLFQFHKCIFQKCFTSLYVPLLLLSSSSFHFFFHAVF